MLTEQNRIDFTKATTFWNCGDAENDIAVIAEPDQVVETSETVDDFKATRGEPKETSTTPFGVVLIWRNQQRAKGLRRGDLFVMDFGEARGAYFDGE